MRELAEMVGPTADSRGDREAHHLDFLSIATRTTPRRRTSRIDDLVAGVGLPRQNGELVGGEGVVVGHTVSLVGSPVGRLASR